MLFQTRKSTLGGAKAKDSRVALRRNSSIAEKPYRVGMPGGKCCSLEDSPKLWTLNPKPETLKPCLIPNSQLLKHFLHCHMGSLLETKPART